MRFFSSRRGSAAVEAALIFPLTVLILAGIISLSISMLGRTEETCADCREKVAEEPQIAGMDVFSALRMRLVFPEEPTGAGSRR